MNGTKFSSIFEQYFPRDLAYEWDNVGLQIGTLQKNITGILLTLDITNEVLDEAIEKNINLIVVHHPVLFRSIKSIITDTYQGSMIEKILSHNVTVYVAHTNFDISNYGMNQILADMIGLQKQQVLDVTTDTEGLGRIGELETEVSLATFISQIKALFQLDGVRIIGELDKMISTVAIAGGSGSSLITKALHSNVDVFLTGDISYHQALDAKNDGLTIVDIGHNIEKFALDGLKQFLVGQDIDVPITISKIDTNPFKFA